MAHEQASGPKRRGVARVVNELSHLASGHLRAPVYARRPLPPSEREPASWALTNVHIVDVRSGRIREERVLLVEGERVTSLLRPAELEALQRGRQVHEVDGREAYVVPGLSDIHCHVSLVSEFEVGLRQLRYFDAQRQRNCEAALESGCTFVRDSGGAYAPVSWLQEEIEAQRLLGPRILPSYEVLTPRGGMWDVGRIANAMAPAIFGGPLLNFVEEDADIDRVLERLVKMGARSFKTYFEDRPLYGGTPDTRYRMFSPNQARRLRDRAERYGRLLEAHSMFLKGSRIAAEACFDSIAHLTVDAPYDEALARILARSSTAVVPTLSLGCYLAQSCGPHGMPDHPDYQFFRELLRSRVPGQIAHTAVPELRPAYESFRSWILRDIPEREMPMVGKVYPERMHGFMVHASRSLNVLREAGVKIGVGTDGGTGITFAGQLDVEIEALLHYGFTSPEVVRMATLGNMEIVRQDAELGSLEPGKLADFVLTGRNPLLDARHLCEIRRVYKGGRCLVSNAPSVSAGSHQDLALGKALHDVP